MIILWFISCAICMAFPPLAVIAVIVFLMVRSCGSANNRQKIHSSMVGFPPCRPFSHEMDEDGMSWGKSYRDKRGRLKYCCNPGHNHFY
ncbi:MAG: hypothetical protein HQL12_09260 [Candidatus Omnitrophica bacterium]|nr:hypothetical protein [Candidatus Omnitrophota bacterium]